MNPAIAHLLGSDLALGALGIAVAMADTRVTSTAIEGIARQPEAADRIMTSTYISVGLIEALPFIVVVLVAFVIH